MFLPHDPHHHIFQHQTLLHAIHEIAAAYRLDAYTTSDCVIGVGPGCTLHFPAFRSAACVLPTIASAGVFWPRHLHYCDTILYIHNLRLLWSILIEREWNAIRRNIFSTVQQYPVTDSQDNSKAKSDQPKVVKDGDTCDMTRFGASDLVLALSENCCKSSAWRCGDFWVQSLKYFDYSSSPPVSLRGLAR